MTRALLFALGLSSAIAHAYPISPRTLWDLTAEAELIVVARIEAVHDDIFAPTSFTQASKPKDQFHEEYARLSVIETLKGPPAEVLEVTTSRGIVCPAPGRFLVGETVLVFLSSYAGGWHAEGRSYGTLYPSPDELPVMKERIASALALQAGDFSFEQKVAWAVGAASRRATRWHGAYELASALDERHAFYDEAKREKVTLTQAQRLILATGFIGEPSADETTAMIVRMLDGYVDPLLDRAFVGAIDALLREENTWTAHQVIKAVIARAGGDPSLLGDAPPDANALRVTWERARIELRLPEGLKLGPRSARVRGVGELTPP